MTQGEYDMINLLTKQNELLAEILKELRKPGPDAGSIPAEVPARSPSVEYAHKSLGITDSAFRQGYLNRAYMQADPLPCVRCGAKRDEPCRNPQRCAL